MRVLLFVLLLTSGCCLTKAQDSTHMFHQVGLRFGLNQIKDENLNPKTSTGTIAEISYGWEKLQRNWQQFYFTLGYSRLKNDLEDLSKSVNLKVQIGYAYSFPVIHKRRIRYYIGPEAALAYSAAFFPNWDDSHLYWADYLSAGIRNNVVVPFQKDKRWITSVTLPFFSLYSRPEPYRLYKIDDTSTGGIASNLNSNVKPAHLTNTTYLKVNTEIRFPVFQRKTQALSYRFEYLRVKDDAGEAFKQIIHELGITFYL